MKTPTGYTTSKRYNRPGLMILTCYKCGKQIDSKNAYKDKQDRDICEACSRKMVEDKT